MVKTGSNIFAERERKIKRKIQWVSPNLIKQILLFCTSANSSQLKDKADQFFVIVCVCVYIAVGKTLLVSAQQKKEIPYGGHKMHCTETSLGVCLLMFAFM